MKIFIVAFTLGFASVAQAQTSALPEVTFHKDVVPILEKNCQTCHRSGDIAPMSLITFQEVRPWAKSMFASGRSFRTCTCAEEAWNSPRSIPTGEPNR